MHDMRATYFNQGDQAASQKGGICAEPCQMRSQVTNGQLNSGLGSSLCKGPEVANSLVRNKLLCTHSHTVRRPNGETAAHSLLPSRDKLGHQDQSDELQSQPFSTTLLGPL